MTRRISVQPCENSSTKPSPLSGVSAKAEGSRRSKRRRQREVGPLVHAKMDHSSGVRAAPSYGSVNAGARVPCSYEMPPPSSASANVRHASAVNEMSEVVTPAQGPPSLVLAASRPRGSHVMGGKKTTRGSVPVQRD